MLKIAKYIKTMILTFESTVTAEINVKSWKDNRIKVNRTIASYRGEDGYEYRKSFESKCVPKVPSQGTHQELNNLKYQY